jgi:hypothetical protein
LEGFKYESGKPKLFTQENGVIREFCDTCGVFICEYGVSALEPGQLLSRVGVWTNDYA